MNLVWAGAKRVFWSLFTVILILYLLDRAQSRVEIVVICGFSIVVSMLNMAFAMVFLTLAHAQMAVAEQIIDLKEIVSGEKDTLPAIFVPVKKNTELSSIGMMIGSFEMMAIMAICLYYLVFR